MNRFGTRLAAVLCYPRAQPVRPRKTVVHICGAQLPARSTFAMFQGADAQRQTAALLRRVQNIAQMMLVPAMPEALRLFKTCLAAMALLLLMRPCVT